MRFLGDRRPAHDLTYADVFMVPNRSAVGSRLEVDLTTPDRVGTTIPVVVANMTAISGRRMAETVARRGGLAVLPQDIPVDVVSEVVSWIKSRHPVYDTPITLSPTSTVGEALALLTKRAHGIVVVVEDGVPVGVVTDGACQGVDRFTQLSQVMAPDPLTIPAGTDLPKIFDVLSEARVSAAPVVEGDRLVGVITRKGALRSALYTPAVNARRPPAHLRRGRHQRRRRGQGVGAAGLRRRRARRGHRARPPGEGDRGAARGAVGRRVDCRSSPATSSPPTAPGADRGGRRRRQGRRRARAPCAPRG